jgi:hypothetical protein
MGRIGEAGVLRHAGHRHTALQQAPRMLPSDLLEETVIRETSNGPEAPREGGPGNPGNPRYVFERERFGEVGFGVVHNAFQPFIASLSGIVCPSGEQREDPKEQRRNGKRAVVGSERSIRVQ